VIGLVLLQHGKGADMGAAFGSGASGSLFGASGSANFLSRATAVLATVFFLTSLGLSYMATKPQGAGAASWTGEDPACGAGRAGAGSNRRRRIRRRKKFRSKECCGAKRKV
jgi:preprotein translocase subunit SecG